MKKFFSIAATAGLAMSLAACSGNDADKAEAGADTATEAMAPADADAAGAAVTAAEPGSYVATYADGTAVPYTTNAVGVYTATVDGKEIKGTYTSEGAKSCFDPAGDGEDQGEVCWTATAADETGKFTATNDAGETVTVTPAS